MVLHTLYTGIIKPSGYFYGNENVTNSGPAIPTVILRKRGALMRYERKINQE